MTKSISVQDLDEFTKKWDALKERKTALNKDLSEVNAEITKMEAQAVVMLDELERSNYKGPGGAIEIRSRHSVQVPKTDQDKQALFDFLKQEGIFEKYVTVNSRSLQTLYNDYRQRAEEDGELTFSMPGVGEPKTFRQAILKKK